MNRGEVVMVDWTYSDRTGSKVRPRLDRADSGAGGRDERSPAAGKAIFHLSLSCSM